MVPPKFLFLLFILVYWRIVAWQCCVPPNFILHKNGNWKLPWTEEPGRLQSMGSLKSWTWLSDFTFTFHFDALEKKMATHSSVLAWRLPGTGEPCGLPSMGSHKVGHDWSDLAAAALTIALILWTFVGKVMSLLFKTLSRFDIVFLPRSEHF